MCLKAFPRAPCPLRHRVRFGVRACVGQAQPKLTTAFAWQETMITKRMGLLKLKEWYEKMLEVAKSRGILVDYQDMQEEYKVS